MLISGILDAQNWFHLVSLLLVSHECTRAYLYLFMVLKQEYAEESSPELDLLFVVANGTTTIIAIVKMVFLGCPRGMC